MNSFEINTNWTLEEASFALQNADWQNFNMELHLVKLRKLLLNLENNYGVTDLHFWVSKKILQRKSFLSHSQIITGPILYSELLADQYFLTISEIEEFDEDVYMDLSIWEIETGKCIVSYNYLFDFEDNKAKIQYSNDLQFLVLETYFGPKVIQVFKNGEIPLFDKSEFYNEAEFILIHSIVLNNNRFDIYENINQSNSYYFKIEDSISDNQIIDLEKVTISDKIKINGFEVNILENAINVKISNNYLIAYSNSELGFYEISTNKEFAYYNFSLKYEETDNQYIAAYKLKSFWKENAFLLSNNEKIFWATINDNYIICPKDQEYLLDYELAYIIENQFAWYFRWTQTKIINIENLSLK